MQLWWAVLALALALLAQGEATAGRGGNGLVLFALAAALYLASRPRQASAGPPVARLDPGDALHLIVAALLLALVLTGISFSLFNGRPNTADPWYAYLLAVAVLLVTALVLLWPRRAGGIAGVRVRHASRLAKRRRALEIWALAAIMGWAAFMRLYRLDAFPAGVFHDEAVNALDALQVLREQWYPAYFPANFGRAPLYEYLLAGAFRLWGVSELTLRLPTVFVGLLTVPLFYRLARLLLPTTPALMATLFLAGSRWHANFSRIAFDAVLAPLFLVLSLFLLLRALGRRSRGAAGEEAAPEQSALAPAGYYLLAGLALGLGLLTYQAFRLAPAIVLGLGALFLVDTGALRRNPLRPGQWFRSDVASGLVMLSLAAFIAAGPVVHYARGHPRETWERARTASILSGRGPWEARHDLAANARAHLVMFNFEGDNNGRHNLPGEPMLHPLPAALFVLGVAGCLASWRQPWALLLLGWLAVMLAAGIFSLPFEAPHSLRTIAVVPAVYLIAAVPLADCRRLWRERFPLPRRYLLAPLLVGAAWFVAGGYGAFFGRQAGDYAVWNAFSTAETRIARELRRLGNPGVAGEGWQVHIDPNLSRHPVLRLLVPEFQEPEPFVTADLLPLSESGARGALIFVGEHNRAIADLVRRWYPYARVVAHANPADGHATMYQFIVSPDDVRQSQGLEMIASWPGTATGSVVVPGIDWAPGEDGALPASITWQGVLLAPRSGAYRFGLESEGEGTVVIDGAVVVATPWQPAATVHLARGRHEIWAQAYPEGSRGVTLRWLPPGEEGEPAPPRERYLYHAPLEPGGLQGDFIAGLEGGWDKPAFSRIDPWLDIYFHVLPLERPYRVRWHGWLLPPMPGHYTLSLQARDRAELWLGGAPVLATEAPERPATVQVALAEATPIEVRFWDETGYTGIWLRWVRPDGVEEVVPYTALRPPAPPVSTPSP